MNTNVTTQPPDAYAQNASHHEDDSRHPMNVIVLIADGMSPQLFQLADTYHTLKTGKHLSLQQAMEPLGLTFTTAWRDEITDSAAAATAIFSGHRTTNGNINVSPESKPLTTITEAAKRQGWRIGIVTTTHLTHATPAGVYAHTQDRDNEAWIADQLFLFQPDVALGGGRKFFRSATHCEDGRSDHVDLIRHFQEMGYDILWNREHLWQRMVQDEQFLSNAAFYSFDRSSYYHPIVSKRHHHSTSTPRPSNKLLALFQPGHMSFEIDRLRLRDEYEPSLAEMTKTALNALMRLNIEQDDGAKPFMLVVEGGRIDHLAHAHDTRAAIEEVIAFDRAIAVALDFQKKHPHTLIIVTSDHDTGGLIWEGSEKQLALHHLDHIEVSLDWLNFLVLGMLERKKYGGFHETPDAFIKHALEDLWGLYLSEDEQKALKAELSHARLKQLKHAVTPSSTLDQTAFQYVLDLANSLITTALNRRIGLNWTTPGHTDGAVLTWAQGPGSSAEIFRGVYHLTDISKKIAIVAQIDFS